MDASTRKKWIFRPLLILVILFLAITVTAVVIVTTQQERLVSLAVAELNKKVSGDLTIQGSSVSLFKHYPRISIGLHELKLFSSKDTTSKPICEFERLYIGFSLADVLLGKYDVKILSLQGGRLDVVKELNGDLNILDAINIKADSTETTKTDTSDFKINLEKISIKQFDLSFVTLENGQKISTHIDELSSSFNLDSIQMKLSLKSKMVLDFTTPSDSTFFRHKRSEIDLDAIYKKGKKQFQIRACTFKLQDASFTMQGYADLTDQSNVDLRIKGDEPDFRLMEAFIPEHTKEVLKPFRYDGRIRFEAIVNGEIANGQLPLIEVSFGCEDAWFLNTRADKKVDQLSFKGYYTNGAGHSLNTSELHIINVSARPEKGVFKGNFIMHDFTDPHTLVQINSELELRFLGEFLGIRDLEQTTGKIKLEMDFKELKDVELPEESLNKLKEGIQSKLSVEGLSFNIPGYPHQVRDMTLHAEMKDGRVTLDSAFLRIGKSDFHLKGSLSDIQAFLHDRQKIVTLNLSATSKSIVLDELLSYDTALAHKYKEEVRDFIFDANFSTTFYQLLHPDPLPHGQFEMKRLSASFAKYPHVLKNIGATLTVNDTLMRLHNLTGLVDKSDFKFSGRIINYHLWFRDVKIGKTQIAFDFKSDRFALEDLLTHETRKLLPRGYRKEEADNVWIRAKADLRYDTTFKFVKAEFVNITGTLKQHNLKLENIKGKLKFSMNNLLVLDTLTGKVGRTDFDISMRLYAGNDPVRKKKMNYLTFKSNFLDGDEIAQYDLAPKKSKKDSLAATLVALPAVDSMSHANSFNIFTLPFSEFRMKVDIGKLKFNKLWVKDLDLRMRMQADHIIYLDTLDMNVADGRVSIKGNLNGSIPDKIFLTSEIKVDQVDLEKMMLKLDHLGQDVVINKNIKGRLTGVIKSYVQVHPNLVPIMSSTKADLNIKVFNGSLVDFAPMQAMAGYFKDKNLRMIRFDTLQNDFTFSNGVLNIPNMDINSSLGYIQMSGTQSLDLTMEYYVRVPMKMVTKVGFNSLFDKNADEVNLDQVDEIEYLDKDKKIRFMNLKVTGKPEDFKVRLGKDKRNRN